MSLDWKRFFPFKESRDEQAQAIEFALDAFLKKGKRFVVAELGTGVGKSAIGIAVSNYINAHLPIAPGYTPGAYILTTQKILQEQYLRDFGPGKGALLSIKSSSNYQCNFYPQQTCAESKRMLNSKLAKKHTNAEFKKCCGAGCPYTIDKNAFIQSPLSITNFSYFMAETMYAGRLEPRQFIVHDEAHNLEAELSKFIEVTFSEKFAKDTLKCKCPVSLRTQQDVFEWVKKTYKPALAKHLERVEEAIEAAIETNNPSFGEFSKQYELLDKHICKVNRFLGNYSDDNWIMNTLRPQDDKKGVRRFEFKPIDVSLYSHDIMFKFAERHLLMSATIIDKDMFCRTLGIKEEEVAFISIDSPFPVENRPVHYLPVGKMSAGDIERTLPKMVEVLREIFKEHANEKGIIHCVDALTPIVMADGSTRLISSLVEGDLVTSWNELQQKFEMAPVSAVMNNGVRDCIELEFDNGKKLVCTPDHRILTKNRGWVCAIELTEFDEIADTMHDTYMHGSTRSS